MLNMSNSSQYQVTVILKSVKKNTCEHTDNRIIATIVLTFKYCPLFTENIFFVISCIIA